MPAPIRPVDRQPVRHNQTLDYEALRQEARTAFDASGLSQRQLAKRIGRSQSAVSRALGEEKAPDIGFADTLIAIVEELTEYRVEKQVLMSFRARRKDASS